MFTSGSAVRVLSILLTTVIAASPVARSNATVTGGQACSTLQQHCPHRARVCCCLDDAPIPPARANDAPRLQPTLDALPLVFLNTPVQPHKLLSVTPSTSGHWRPLDFPLLFSTLPI
jgi:hypothetical protein